MSSLEVIGAGLGRTSTASLKLALTKLGYKAGLIFEENFEFSFFISWKPHLFLGQLLSAFLLVGINKKMQCMIFLFLRRWPQSNVSVGGQFFLEYFYICFPKIVEILKSFTNILALLLARKIPSAQASVAVLVF